jgi:hypothetical protein
MSRKRLNTVQIAELLAIAGSRRDATESERIQAVNRLLDEFRLQIEEYRKREYTFRQRRSSHKLRKNSPRDIVDPRLRNAIDPLLIQGIQEWGLAIFAQAHPIQALARFLGKKQRPGKRAKNAGRDFSIAHAVVLKMKDGMTLEDAAASVAADYRPKLKLDADTIRKIYVRKQKEVRAAQRWL